MYPTSDSFFSQPIRIKETILKEQLRQHGFSFTEFPADHSIFCEHIKLFYPGMILHSYEAYITDSLSFPKDLPGDIVILYIGDFSDTPILHLPTVSFIHFSTPVELVKVFSILQDFFLAFYQWDAQLKNILYTNGDIFMLAETTYHFLKKPISIFDENYIILVRTGGHTGTYPTESEYNSVLKHYVYTKATVYTWKDSPLMMKAMQTRGAQWILMDENNPDSTSIYSNLYTSTGKWKGRVIFHHGDTPLQESDRDLLDYFTPFVMQLLLKNTQVSDQINQILKNTLDESLNYQTVNPIHFLNILQVLGWHLDDTYQCFCLKQVKDYSSMNTEQLTCMNIENKLFQSRAFLYKEYIVILINLTASQQTSDEARMKMAYILRDGLFHMGISMLFSNLSDFPISYLQATAALNLQKENSSIWYYHFQDCRLRYCIQVLKDDKLISSIYNSAMKTLQNYDQKNGTEFFETLGVYLEQERSIKQTALHFHINRTTVNYRLARIEELTGIDLNNSDEQLLLRILFKLHEEGIDA